ncbi:hypothetical protein Tco_1130290, partial [Tanacetum coccineum]
SFDYRYTIKECSSCGALYTRNCGCSKGSLEDKILVPVPDLSQRPLIFEKICLNCGDPVHGLYCRQCALIRKTLEEVFQEILNTSESSNDNTNIVSAPQDPFIFNQDPGQNSSRSPPHIDHHCCYECGDSLDDIFCQRCTCKSCGKGAHYGYNCPPQIPIISNPEPCYNQNLNEILQNLQSLQQQCLLGTCQQCGCNEYDGVCFYCTVGNGTPINFSTPYSSNDSPSFANHPPQPQYVPYSCELCGNDSHYGYDCPPQVPFQAAKDRYWKIPICYDDDEDYTIAITPVLSTEEPVDSLIMKDEHLDAIPATESDKVIKSSVENLVLTPSESEGIPNKMCDVPLCDNPTPLEAFKDHSQIVVDSNDDSSSSDDDSFSSKDIEYVNASPPNAEIVSLEVVEIVIPEVGGIDDDILLTIKDDILREKLSNVNLLIAKIEALKDNPTLSSDFMTKSSSTSPNFFLEETNTFDNSLLESETFCFNLEEISSGSTTTHSDYSLLDYEAFYSMTIILKRRVVAVPLLMLIFLNMIRSSLISRSICFLLPIGVIFIMRNSPMNSLTSYLHRSMIGFTLRMTAETIALQTEVARCHLSTADNVKHREKSSRSTTTHADFSKYDSFIFDLSINRFPPTDKSDFYHEEFTDELAHIISPLEYDCFCFKNEPERGDFTMDVVEDIFPTREPRVHVPSAMREYPPMSTLDLDLDFTHF